MVFPTRPHPGKFINWERPRGYGEFRNNMHMYGMELHGALGTGRRYGLLTAQEDKALVGWIKFINEQERTFTVGHNAPIYTSQIRSMVATVDQRRSNMLASQT